jgi:hypothetical protein
MSSNGAVSNGRSADCLNGRADLLARPAADLALVEQEIDRLWSDAMQTENLALSERLAEVSHALQRAAHLLAQGYEIG